MPEICVLGVLVLVVAQIMCIFCIFRSASRVEVHTRALPQKEVIDGVSAEFVHPGQIGLRIDVFSEARLQLEVRRRLRLPVVPLPLVLPRHRRHKLLSQSDRFFF